MLAVNWTVAVRARRGSRKDKNQEDAGAAEEEEPRDGCVTEAGVEVREASEEEQEVKVTSNNLTVLSLKGGKLRSKDLGEGGNWCRFRHQESELL